MTAVDTARQLARDHLADPLPRRWHHVQAVADEAHRLADAVGCDLTTLACAAWLHDIGYAPHLVDTGFHPLDGARFLRRAGWPDDICNLVAHHSCARVEANERNLGRELLVEFTDTPTSERDALWTADATTGPDGQRMTPWTNASTKSWNGTGLITLWPGACEGSVPNSMPRSPAPMPAVRPAGTGWRDADEGPRPRPLRSNHRR